MSLSLGPFSLLERPVLPRFGWSSTGVAPPPALDADFWLKLATLIVSALVAILAIYRYTEEKRKSREDAARQKFDKYLDESAGNVEFLIDYWSTRHARTAQELMRYRLFVDRTLWACEEAILAYSSDDWRACIDNQLRYHESYFRSTTFHLHIASLHPRLADQLRKLGYIC